MYVLQWEFIELNATHECIFKWWKCNIVWYVEFTYTWIFSMECNAIFNFSTKCSRKLEIQFSFPRMRELHRFLFCSPTSSRCLHTTSDDSNYYFSTNFTLFFMIWSCLQCFLYLNFKLKKQNRINRTMTHDASVSPSALRERKCILSWNCFGASFGVAIIIAAININHIAIQTKWNSTQYCNRQDVCCL